MLQPPSWCPWLIQEHVSSVWSGTVIIIGHWIIQRLLLGENIRAGEQSGRENVHFD